MKKRQANLERSDENIADQYPDLIDGIQKDAIQNANDAKQARKYSNWKVSFKYRRSDNVLIIEDFGTTGMDANCWEHKFWEGPWHTEKVGTSDAGQRGQGRYLFHNFSTNKTILAETIDENGNYRFGWGTPAEYDDTGKTLSDFFPGAPKLDHQGTRIWVLDVRKDLRHDLLDTDRFSRYIEASWWEIIRNFDATVVVDFEDQEKLVVLPTLPEPKKEKHFKDDKVADLGKVRNLVIRFSEDEVPEHFRGIAVQRAGMTVKRIVVKADENLAKRIYGYCNFDEDLEKNLKACELPNHMDFQNKKAWNHVKDYVNSRLDSFLLEISPQKKKIQVDESMLDAAARILNSLIEEFAPELSEKDELPGGKKREGNESSSPKPKPPVRIGSFTPNQRSIDFGDSLKIDCTVVNETQKAGDYKLLISVKHESGKTKLPAKYELHLTPQSSQDVAVPLIDFERRVDEPGKYSAEASLKNARGEEIDKRSFTFYVAQEPPPPEKGKAFVKEFKFAHGKGIHFERWRNIPINDKGQILVIWDHPEFVRLREDALEKSKKMWLKVIQLYCIERGADEAMAKLIEKKLSEGQLTSEAVSDVRIIHSEIVYAAHRGIFS